MVKKFSDDSTGPGRALQIWQILIGKAHNRQTITYGALANMIGYSNAQPIPNILNYIMKYCDQYDLPPLTALVVNKESGAPGGGLTTLRDLDADREDVFNYDWYALMPPTPVEFRQIQN